MQNSPSALTPLPLKFSLASTPSAPLLAEKCVRLASDEELRVADPTACRALIALMDMNAVLGGAASHYGGPAALAEINSALYGLVFARASREARPWFELFHLINDAGHTENGLYALKALYGFADLSIAELKQFRSIKSRLAGHGESHLFPQGVLLSNGPLGSSLAQAQGLALGDRLQGHPRTTVCTISDGACMEGEAKEAMASIPGMAERGQMAPFVLIISDNDTKLSGRITQDSFSMAPSFASLEVLGWRVLPLADGHNLEACARVLREALELAAADPTRPVAVHARTIKGKGVAQTEKSASGGHGFPLKAASEIRAFVNEIYSHQPLPPFIEQWVAELEATAGGAVGAAAAGGAVGDAASGAGAERKSAPSEKIQAGVSRALISAQQRGLPVLSLTSDLPGSTGVADFRKKFPAASFDFGVAEANMVSAAVGLSKLGYIPVVDTFAQFGVTKGALPLIMGALSEAPVICIFSHTGFQDAADGASHQTLSYLAMTAAIPKSLVVALTCAEEAEALVGQAIDKFAADRRAGRTPEHTIFFLGRENFPRSFSANSIYKLGRAQVIAPSEPGSWSGGARGGDARGGDARGGDARGPEALAVEAPDGGDGARSVALAPAIVLAACGSLLREAIEAQKLLSQQGVGTLVVNASAINKPDVETFSTCLRQTDGRLLTIEDHQLRGGFGAQLIHALTCAGLSPKVHSLGVDDQFGRSAYEARELYQLHEIDSAAIVKAALKLLG